MQRLKYTGKVCTQPKKNMKKDAADIATQRASNPTLNGWPGRNLLKLSQKWTFCKNMLNKIENTKRKTSQLRRKNSEESASDRPIEKLIKIKHLRNKWIYLTKKIKLGGIKKSFHFKPCLQLG